MTVVVKRVTVKNAKVRKLLYTPQMIAHIAARGSRVKAAAEALVPLVEGVPGRIPLPVRLQVNKKRRRARARIILDHPAGIAAEAKHAVLAIAIDAARG